MQYYQLAIQVQYASRGYRGNCYTEVEQDGTGAGQGESGIIFVTKSAIAISRLGECASAGLNLTLQFL